LTKIVQHAILDLKIGHSHNILAIISVHMDTKLIFDEQSKTTRGRVLQTLLSRNRCTINEIADVVDINPISVRHHITKLEADGLVSSEEERHGVGRPRRLYFLTEEGLERFPSRYLRLTLRLLEQLKDTMPEQMVNQLFTQMAQEVASDYVGRLKGLNMDQRLELVTELLRDEGFTVEWEKRKDEYIIHEISCPYYHIGQNYPEVCSVDQTLISTMLSVPAEKVQCLLNGDAHCSYIIPNLTSVE
jgi:DeoR family suf operon transcriptional repressor